MAAPTDPLALLATAAGDRYDNEPISQLDHALQAAACALADGAPDALVVAVLLHDVGHLLVRDAGAASLDGRDLRHEDIGARWLARRFGPEVVEPVRLHVAAKRHLTRDPDYAASLSEESTRSLALQGGPFDDDEDRAFLATPFAGDAIALRRWDDRAKDPQASPPALDAHRARVDALLSGAPAADRPA